MLIKKKQQQKKLIHFNGGMLFVVVVCCWVYKCRRNSKWSFEIHNIISNLISYRH